VQTRHLPERAQTVVEFALVILALLSIVMGIIEFGRLLQTWMTVQNCAQTAARFATTGQCAVDPTSPGWQQDAARLQCIKDAARDAAASLSVIGGAGVFDPGYFDISVHASDPPTPDPDLQYPGGPNARVAVDVTYNHPLITPIVSRLLPWITLRAHAEMINERFRHPGYGTPPGELPPTIRPTSTPTPTPSPTPTPTP
jgi:TadE-like protein